MIRSNTAHLACLALVLFVATSDTLIGSEIRVRRPIAIATGTEPNAFVANRVAGSVSLLDLTNKRVVGEVVVGKQLSDIVVVNDGQHLLVSDESRGKLIVLRHANGDLIVIREIDVPPHPVSIAISPDGENCSVASLWSRRLTLIRLSTLLDKNQVPSLRTIDMNIAPRTQCWLSNQRLAVADSFGGKVTIVDAEQSQRLTRLTLEGHNIRGMALNDTKSHLHITHQILNGLEPTTRSRVFWGDVMGNVLRSVALDHIHERCDQARTELLRNSIDQETDTQPEIADSNDASTNPCFEQKVAHWTFHPLGEPSNAAGDPGPILVNAEGRTAVLISGTNEVALRTGDHKIFSRKAVGRRPVAGAITLDGKTALVANYFDDSVSLISLRDKSVTHTISLGQQPDLTLEQEGEALFYDATLSLDRWYSCHSCHTDGHTNGQLNDNFGDDSYGAPKRVLSLLGAAETGPWAWNGAEQDLHQQVAKSIEVTMQGTSTTKVRENSAKAITAYVHTLSPAPSLRQLRNDAEPSAVERGKKAFDAIGCTDCHTPTRYTSDERFDMGIPDENGMSEFNPPSLLGVSQRTALLHDGRAATIAEVFDTSKHSELTSGLDEQSKQDLIVFLENL